MKKRTVPNQVPQNGKSKLMQRQRPKSGPASQDQAVSKPGSPENLNVLILLGLLSTETMDFDLKIATYHKLSEALPTERSRGLARQIRDLTLTAAELEADLKDCFSPIKPGGVPAGTNPDTPDAKAGVNDAREDRLLEGWAKVEREMIKLEPRPRGAQAGCRAGRLYAVTAHADPKAQKALRGLARYEKNNARPETLGALAKAMKLDYAELRRDLRLAHGDVITSADWLTGFIDGALAEFQAGFITTGRRIGA